MRMPSTRAAISLPDQVPLLNSAFVFFTVSWYFWFLTIMGLFCSAISVAPGKDSFIMESSCLISSIVKYMKRPSARNRIFLPAPESPSLTLPHQLASRMFPAIIVTRSCPAKIFLRSSIESGKSTSNHKMLPLSTRENRLSNPAPRFMMAASGFFATKSFTMRSSMSVRAMTPSCDMNLSYGSVARLSVFTTFTAASSWMRAFLRRLSLALTATGISAVVCTSPRFRSIEYPSLCVRYNNILLACSNTNAPLFQWGKSRFCHAVQASPWPPGNCSPRCLRSS